MLDRTRGAIQFKGQYATAHLPQLSSRVNRALDTPRRITRFNTPGTLSSAYSASRSTGGTRARRALEDIPHRTSSIERSTSLITQAQGRAPTSEWIKISARLSLLTRASAKTLLFLRPSSYAISASGKRRYYICRTTNFCVLIGCREVRKLFYSAAD